MAARIRSRLVTGTNDGLGRPDQVGRDKAFMSLVLIVLLYG